ncbi:MAG: SDR family oxidoreductase [Candidatus Sumerlaeia bacterium]
MTDQYKQDQIPGQEQSHQPGKREAMEPEPADSMKDYKGSEKLEGKKALVTGGDSGIGRAVSIGFAKEGADVAVVYLEEDQDARSTRDLVEKTGRKCILIKGDAGSRQFCDEAVEKAVSDLGGLDILVNNAAEQHPVDSFQDITDAQWDRTFKTNIYAYFYMSRAALKHIPEGGSILCTTSVLAYQGHKTLIDYACTKAAIVGLVRSLSQSLGDKKIRVNGVAPGPIWTPLIPASFREEKVDNFGGNTILGRAGKADEVAPCFIFLASTDASYMTGQILHPNGGRIVNA